MWKACKNINYCVNPLEFEELEPYQQSQVINWFLLETQEEEDAQKEADRRAKTFNKNRSRDGKRHSIQRGRS